MGHRLAPGGTVGPVGLKRRGAGGNGATPSPDGQGETRPGPEARLRAR